MNAPLWRIDEEDVRTQARNRVDELVGNHSNGYYVYVLECSPEIHLRREIEDYDGKAIVDAVRNGEDAWLDYPAKVEPPMGERESNFPRWIDQAVEADEVYYVGQTTKPVERIVEHAIAGDESAYATRLFPPASIVHIEQVESRENAYAMEDLISQFITFGCEIVSEHRMGYGEVPDKIHDRLLEFANPDGPTLEIANGRNLRAFHSAPNNHRTAELIYYLTESPFGSTHFDMAEEYDAFPLKRSVVIHWYLSSLERIPGKASFKYQEEILRNHVERFESWIEASDTYPDRGDDLGGEWEAEDGIESTEEGERYYRELHELMKERLVGPFLTDFRQKTRELHPSPLRFAYSDKRPNKGLKNLYSGSSTPGEPSDELTSEEKSRLQDIIEFAPSTDDELQERWGLEETGDVYHYLEDHLSSQYYRDSDHQIHPTSKAEEFL
ncbi:DUF5797 family protein [Halorubrum sp. FL23]|uniref:DUF5797 family protein n=1 Tax=Halorubrum sp. FL23 TaxID=3458704 RepID=UPI004033CCB9